MFIRAIDTQAVANGDKGTSGLGLAGALSLGSSIVAGFQAIADNFKSRRKEVPAAQAAAEAIAAAAHKSVPELQAQANLNGYDSRSYFGSLGVAFDDGAALGSDEEMNRAFAQAEQESKSTILPLLLAGAAALLLLPMLTRSGRRFAGRTGRALSRARGRFRRARPRFRRPTFRRSFRRGRR